MSISDSIKNKNRRIATNSILLFVRMIVVMLINLFTMRWILRGLGFQDYGIYAAVTGMVTVCSCIGNVLTLGTQRFYSYALGEHNDRKMKEIFTISTHLVIGLSFGLVLVYEIIGPWFISNHLSLPPLRVETANSVMQYALFAFIFSLVQIPFQADVFSHEDMDIYAIISLADSGVKLLIAVMISFSANDHLALYALALMIESGLVMLTYICVCASKYRECRMLRSMPSRSLYKELLSFSGWTFYSSLAGVGMTQGSNILLNMFFGPTTNATFGVSMQVYSALITLSNTVAFAFRPAMTKAYSGNDEYYMKHLFYLFNKMLLILAVCVAVPMLIGTKHILVLWLGQPSESLVLYTRLYIVYTMCLIMHNPITTCIQAIGKMKRYSLCVESITILSVPLTWLGFRCGAPAHYVFYIMIGLSLTAHIMRIHVLHRYFPSITYSRYLVNIFKFDF